MGRSTFVLALLAATFALAPMARALDGPPKEIRALVEGFAEDPSRGAPQRQGRERVWFERKTEDAPRKWLTATLDKPVPEPLLPEMARDVAEVRLSAEGRYIAFATEPAQRDARTWSIFDRRTGYMLEWRAEDAAKGSSLIWRRDSSSVIYIRKGERDALVERGIRSGITNRIVTHSQARRRLDVAAPEGGNSAFLVAGDDEHRRSQVWLLIDGRDWGLELVASVEGAHFEPVYADRERVVLWTDHQAPRGRVVVARRGELNPDEWRTLVAEPEPGSLLEQAEWLDGWVAARIQRPQRRETRWHAATDENASAAERRSNR
jgi:hypothetical protein